MPRAARCRTAALALAASALAACALEHAPLEPRGAPRTDAGGGAAVDAAEDIAADDAGVDAADDVALADAMDARDTGGLADAQDVVDAADEDPGPRDVADVPLVDVDDAAPDVVGVVDVVDVVPDVPAVDGGCPAGRFDCDGDPLNGCEAATTCTYSTCRDVPRAFPSGVYRLTAGGTPWNAYCDMTAADGPWTLVLKARGTESEFRYDSPLWSDATLRNEAMPGLARVSAKYQGFVSMPFRRVRVQLFTPPDGATGHALSLTFVRDGDAPIGSLRLAFMGGGHRAPMPEAGRAAWLGLVPGSHLQPNCDREGLNVATGGGDRVRIGIIGNNENNCNTPDSRLGVGGEGLSCFAPGAAGVTVGNAAGCLTVRAITSFAYVWIR